MNRRDFLRVIAWTITAVVAGAPIAAAWQDSIARARRRALITGQLRYQAEQSLHAIMRDVGRQLYGFGE